MSPSRSTPARDASPAGDGKPAPSAQSCAPNPPKLEAEALAKSYARGGRAGGAPVLRGISFTVRQGEFLSILGPSGCGKTTLLRILAGLLPPDEGVLRKDGNDITAAPPAARGMGIVFQNYALFENMTALQNVAYALRFRKPKPSRAAREERARQMLAAVGLSAHEDKYPGELSGGQMQRVAIARTLALSPDILLFDEPMSALDAEARLAMREELLSLREKFGSTMIYVTHDQEEAFALSDRVMILQEGQIAQIDSPEGILAHPANDYVRSFVLDNLEAKLASLSRFRRGGDQ